jgi:hypothetical protein
MDRKEDECVCVCVCVCVGRIHLAEDGDRLRLLMKNIKNFVFSKTRGIRCLSERIRVSHEELRSMDCRNTILDITHFLRCI